MWGGHCCEANISAMCLIRLCGIKIRIPGMGINTDRQTVGQTDSRTDAQASWWQQSSAVFAHIISALTKHLKPPSLPPCPLFLLLFTYLVFQTGDGGGVRSPTWFADRLGPSRRQAEQEQNRSQHSSFSDDNNKNVETAESERKSSELVDRRRGGWWGEGGE